MQKLRIGDVGVTLYLLAAFVMLIVPIKSGLLDVLLACNIAVAFTVMFSCMFANEVLKIHDRVQDCAECFLHETDFVYRRRRQRGADLRSVCGRR